MAKTFEHNALHRIVNPLIKALVRLGLGPKQSRILSVTGRRSGRRYETPVNLVLRDGERFLVSPYGTKGWYQNARAAGSVGLRRGGTEEVVAIQQLAPPEATPILRQYFEENAVTRPYFDVEASSSDEAFAAEAPRHPVFRILKPGRSG